jgi:hypothetical protein
VIEYWNTSMVEVTDDSTNTQMVSALSRLTWHPILRS